MTQSLAFLVDQNYQKNDDNEPQSLRCRGININKRKKKKKNETRSLALGIVFLYLSNLKIST